MSVFGHHGLPYNGRRFLPQPVRTMLRVLTVFCSIRKLPMSSDSQYTQQSIRLLEMHCTFSINP